MNVRGLAAAFLSVVALSYVSAQDVLKSINSSSDGSSLFIVPSVQQLTKFADVTCALTGNGNTTNIDSIKNIILQLNSTLGGLSEFLAAKSNKSNDLGAKGSDVISINSGNNAVGSPNETINDQWLNQMANKSESFWENLTNISNIFSGIQSGVNNLENMFTIFGSSLENEAAKVNESSSSTTRTSKSKEKDDFSSIAETLKAIQSLMKISEASSGKNKKKTGKSSADALQLIIEYGLPLLKSLLDDDVSDIMRGLQIIFGKTNHNKSIDFSQTLHDIEPFLSILGEDNDDNNDVEGKSGSKLNVRSLIKMFMSIQEFLNKLEISFDEHDKASEKTSQLSKTLLIQGLKAFLKLFMNGDDEPKSSTQPERKPPHKGNLTITAKTYDSTDTYLPHDPSVLVNPNKTIEKSSNLTLPATVPATDDSQDPKSIIEDMRSKIQQNLEEKLKKSVTNGFRSTNSGFNARIRWQGYL